MGLIIGILIFGALACMVGTAIAMAVGIFGRKR
jgi:hypothetical protein